MTLAVEIANLSVGYGGGTQVVRDLSLRVPAGGRLGIAGESGCGKSTLLKALAGLLPCNGSCRVEGPVGYIPQEGLSSLSPFLTVGSQVTEFTRSDGETARLFARAGMDGPRYAAAYPHQLSGGERQRVLTIQALALRPRVILADEPTANLDAASEALILCLINESGAAVVIASHRERVFQALGCEMFRMTPEVAVGAAAEAVVAGPVLVEVRGLSKSHYRRDWLMRPRAVVKAVDEASLEIRVGEAVALVGASGAGKSTLARCLAGRDGFDAGGIFRTASHCQLVQQEPSESLNPSFTIRQALAEASGQADAQRLADVNLPPEWIDRKVSALSEGQRARVAILRSAACLDGGLLILDESLSGLDPATRSHIIAYLQRRQRESGLSVLLVTHDLEAAAELGARVVRMEAGRVA